MRFLVLKDQVVYWVIHSPKSPGFSQEKSLARDFEYPSVSCRVLAIRAACPCPCEGAGTGWSSRSLLWFSTADVQTHLKINLNFPHLTVFTSVVTIPPYYWGLLSNQGKKHKSPLQSSRNENAIATSRDRAGCHCRLAPAPCSCLKSSAHSS